MHTIPLPALHRQPDTDSPATDTMVMAGWLVVSLVLLDLVTSAFGTAPTGARLAVWLCIVASPLAVAVIWHRRV